MSIPSIFSKRWKARKNKATPAPTAPPPPPKTEVVSKPRREPRPETRVAVPVARSPLTKPAPVIPPPVPPRTEVAIPAPKPRLEDLPVEELVALAEAKTGKKTRSRRPEYLIGLIRG